MLTTCVLFERYEKLLLFLCVLSSNLLFWSSPAPVLAFICGAIQFRSITKGDNPHVVTYIDGRKGSSYSCLDSHGAACAGLPADQQDRKPGWTECRP